jgi:hypothetical protein
MASPFFDAMLVGALIDERFSDGLMLGGQVGGYIANRLRLAARLFVPTDPTSESSQSHLVGWSFADETPDFMFGGVVGVVVSQRSSFVFSPGFAVHRTNLADHGTIIGADFPFEWVLRGGVRFGLDATVGRAIGGRVRGECVEPPQVVQMFCDPNEERDEERESGVAFMLGFQVGFGLGYPEPLPSKPATTP